MTTRALLLLPVTLLALAAPAAVSCGPGHDLTEWVDTRDPHDRYLGCEVVREYPGY